jgi:pimeloyl-ACP methyl ester carboxylesterase
LAVRVWEPATAARQRPAFLLVHGLASNARLWDGVASSLATAGAHVVAVDLRGHGQSDKPDDGYDCATISRDLCELSGGLGLHRPFVVGQSWGASVTGELACRYPDLTSGIAGVDGALADLQDRFPEWADCARELAPPRTIGLPREAIEARLRTHHPDWPAEALDGALANFEVRPDGTVAPWLTFERHMQILRSLWEERIFERWAEVHVPALVCPADTGEQAWTDTKRAGVARVQAIHGPTRACWFVGDHDIHAQHPTELAGALQRAVVDGFVG